MNEIHKFFNVFGKCKYIYTLNSAPHWTAWWASQGLSFMVTTTGRKVVKSSQELRVQIHSNAPSECLSSASSHNTRETGFFWVQVSLKEVWQWGSAGASAKSALHLMGVPSTGLEKPFHIHLSIGGLSLRVCSKDCQRPTSASARTHQRSFSSKMYTGRGRAARGWPLFCTVTAFSTVSSSLAPVVLRWPMLYSLRTALPCCPVCLFLWCVGLRLEPCTHSVFNEWHPQSCHWLYSRLMKGNFVHWSCSPFPFLAFFFISQPNRNLELLLTPEIAVPPTALF